ncbi:MAG: DUF5658 family protein, partial [Candidatus Dormibacteria bacterium]
EEGDTVSTRNWFALVVLFSMTDWLITSHIINAGGAEANPFMAHVILYHGLAAMLAIKMVVLACLLIALILSNPVSSWVGTAVKWLGITQGAAVIYGLVLLGVG